MDRIRTCLWFDIQAEEAARFYTSVFKNSKLGAITLYPEAGQDIHGKSAGSVMTVEFELNEQPFIALNGGPNFTFNEAISIEITVREDELDYYWEKLSEGGDPTAQQCGWLKDKFGLSWQIVPEGLQELLDDPDKAKANRAFDAMLHMKKLDMAELRRAVEG